MEYNYIFIVCFIGGRGEFMQFDNIEALLFDSGRVLNIPQSGHWFIAPRFFDYVDRATFNSINPEKITMGFVKATSYINSVPNIVTIKEELEHFQNFYRIFSDEVPALGLGEAEGNALAEDLVCNAEKYLFFDEVYTVIPMLYQHYKLAVISDAWPSLKDVYRKAGLYSYFSSFIISSVLGVSKPNKEMYLSALRELRINPEKSIFIDDNIKNCIGAVECGINAVLLCRDKISYDLQKNEGIKNGYVVMNSLDELLCSLTMQ